MKTQPAHKWFKSLFGRRRPPTCRQPSRTRLGVELFEERALPSISIPLNGQTWTAIGPSPIAVGQGPGQPSSTGRLNGVAVDSTNPSIIYVAADGGGIWRTTDGGTHWSPRTDQQATLMLDIATVHRGTGTVGADNTVYAFDQNGHFFRSTDGATTFTDLTVADPTNQIPKGTTVNKLTVFVTDPTDQTKDVLYAAVGNIFGIPPAGTGFGQVNGSGIWRSMDGGTTWANIVDSTVSPFTVSSATPVLPNSLSFSDVAVDPTNPNVVYAAVGNFFGDPTNGLYRTANALSANPTWTLLIGGSAFVPGETPGNITIAVSPVLPSEIFISVALRQDPRTGFTPLLGVFRSLDAGANWTPVLIANPNSPLGDPNNYMGSSGADNNVIVIDPNSPTNPLQQILYVAGDGGNNAVMRSTDSGTTWSPIAIGINGVGTYTNIHQAAFDNQDRLVLATGGGVYRLNTITPVTWESLNGNVGPTGLNVPQFNGFALSPTNADQAVGNLSWNGDAPSDLFTDSTGATFINPGNPYLIYGANGIHNAVLFADNGGLSNLAYGWQTVDAPNGIDLHAGSGQVIYNPFNSQIVYRVTPGNNGAGSNDFVRRSNDGGLTWTGVTTGFQSSPFNPGLYTVPLAIDPSVPNRIFSGFNQVQVSDDNGDTWGTSMQVTITGGKTQIPDLPTTLVDGNHGGPIGITTIGVGRESGVGFGINGVNLFVGTTDDSLRNATGDPQNNAAGTGPQLYVNLIPTNSFPWPPPMTNWNNHSWANITPTDSTGAPVFVLGDTIDQVLVDPTNNATLYVYARHTDALTGQESIKIFRGTNFGLGFSIDGNKNIVWVPNPGMTWTDITGTLPVGTIPADRPQNLALDPRIVTDPTDDTLYAGTASGVWKLSNPAADFSTTPPVWTQVGLDSSSNITLPPVPVSAISLNTSTGILGAATYGRGVYELQVRGLISGHVFTDTNGNGQFDTGEPAFAGVTVEVIDKANNNAIVAATTTDANGFYQFRSLTAGDYSVVALISQTGEVQTTGIPASLSNFTEQSTTTVDFGFFAAGSISGTKFLDTNADGVQDNKEAGLRGFTIYIDLNNNGTLDPGEPSTVTANDGSYSFTNLGPNVIGGQPNPNGGPYHLREIQQPHFVATSPAAGQALTFSLTSGQAVTGANFGNRHPGTSTFPPTPVLVTSEDAGGLPVVRVQNLTTNQVTTFNAYASTFRGGVRVATGMFSNSALPDIVTAPGPGGGPHIRVLNPIDGSVIAQFFAYDSTFSGGVYVATGDVNGDGIPDIITGADAGGGPHVKVFDGAALMSGQVVVLKSFFAYSASFHGGVRVASADVNGDGIADIITAAGPGGGPHVEVFDGATGQLIRSYFAYASTFTGGVYVAAADVNGDGDADIITGPGSGGPHLRVFNGATNGTLLAESYAFPPTDPAGQFPNDRVWSAGLRVATVANFNPAGRPAVIVGPGAGRGPLVKLIDPLTMSMLTPPGQLTVFDSTFMGGIFVAGD
jgi:photosystem II stability/assembly factor-like uncharacterized protein